MLAFPPLFLFLFHSFGAKPYMRSTSSACISMTVPRLSFIVGPNSPPTSVKSRGSRVHLATRWALEGAFSLASLTWERKKERKREREERERKKKEEEEEKKVFRTVSGTGMHCRSMSFSLSPMRRWQRKHVGLWQPIFFFFKQKSNKSTYWLKWCLKKQLGFSSFRYTCTI